MGPRTLSEIISKTPEVHVPPLEIPKTDPAWESIDTYLDGFRNYPGKSKQGYVYVVEVEGARRRLKIGCTTGPRRRISDFRRDAQNIGDRLTRVWVSPVHLNYGVTETLSLQEARAISPSFTKTSEWFPSLPFDTAQAIVARNTESISASTLLTAKREEREREQAATKREELKDRYVSPRPPQHSDGPDGTLQPLAVGEFTPIPSYLRERLYPQNEKERRSRRYPMAIL
ncbi:GIY-YIG nuclease family protein [Streptomyces klenkii]|uniref:GIY-YIG nuclease family protein n=1 Tax=Streptomyces klenkii TaxID=1420899 RepID=UPI001319EA13|nr:GIY-YIG nuclease family protein [Streptomyces klenkii]